MKVTKNKIQAFVKHKLATDRNWALRALMVVYSNQTADEQSTYTTKYHNGTGFCGTDAEILTSFAEQYRRKGSLSRKQMVLLFKKIPKYHNQVISASEKQGRYDSLVRQVEQVEEHKTVTV